MSLPSVDSIFAEVQYLALDSIFAEHKYSILNSIFTDKQYLPLNFIFADIYSSKFHIRNNLINQAVYFG